jgi:hypothetical protein
MLRRLALVLMLLFSTAAVAETTPVDVPMKVEPRGVFVGEWWRYQHHSAWGGLGMRIFADLVAIPAGIIGWDYQDAALAILISGSTIAFSIPLNPSIDVRLQKSLQDKLGPGHFILWTPYGDTVIWLSIWSAIGTTLFYGLSSGNSPYVETAVLAFEAFWVAQIYTNLIKLFTGREGPRDGNGQGDFHGPSAYTRLFPSGTPSGHLATMYAMFSVVMYYWNTPLLWILLNTVAIVAGVTMVMDNYHFTSEVILAAGIGFFTGRWVVHHRSSRFRYNDQGKVERIMDSISIAPAILPGAGYGLALGFAF